MKQDRVEEFKTIYQNNQTNKVIPFLQSLTAKERKEIVSYIRSSDHLSHRKKNNEIILAAAFACCTKGQYERIVKWYSPEITELIDEVLAWQCPEWLSDYYNELARNSWGSIDYDTLTRWQTKGYLQPAHELIAMALAIRPQTYNKETQTRVFDDDFMEKNPLTLNEHIWSLFCSTSSIAFQDSYGNDKNKTDGVWTRIFKKYTASGQIDRKRVLRECLLTVTQDLGRDHSGWFAGLFASLNPTPEELLTMQDELFGTFNGKYTKLTNKALDAIKLIADHPDFQKELFLSHLALLLSSETKSITQSAIAILVKVAKANPDLQENICCEAAVAFLNKDKSIQSKVAKLITQYGSPASDNIKNAIAPYEDVILMDIKAELSDYLKTSEEKGISASIEEEFSTDLQAPQYDDQPVSTIESIEDLIFFLSRIFKENTPLNSDLLADALIRLTPQITSAHLNQLEIALNEAYSISLGDPFWHNYDYKTKEYTGTSFWGIGLYQRLTALFFINYCQYLSSKYPQEGRLFSQMHKEAIELAKKSTYQKWFKDGDRKIVPLNQWYGKDFKLLQPYLDIFDYTLVKIGKANTLPLLSMPTHHPAWIAPAKFVERIALYQQAKAEPDPMDLQLALSRCAPGTEEECIQLAKAQLNDTYSAYILNYFSDANNAQSKSSSIFSFLKNEKVLYNHKAIEAHCSTYTWEIAEKKEVDSTYTERPVLKMHIPASPWEPEKSLYAGIGDNIRYYISPWDIGYLCMMFPSMPDIPYSLLISDRLRFAQMENAETRDMLQIAIASLYDNKINVDGITSLFLACCMLCSEKNIRNYATEIWIERTSYHLIDNQHFGTLLGKLLSKEWAPVKRFTDAAINQLLSIDAHHNQQLEHVVISILMQIKQPVTNLKKLLELYSELLSVNASVVDNQLTAQLREWENESNLKKIVKQILEKL